MGITSLTPLQACLIAVSGFVIVFLMLAVLILIIHVVSRAVNGLEKKAAADLPAASLAVEPVVSSEPQVYSGQIQLLGVDEKTAACLMAIISEETGIPLSQLVFKKIRALDDGGAEK